MSELITLSRKDPKYLGYMRGTFSKELRAIPIQSLNVNSQSEQVTFQIVPREKIEPPFLGLHWLQVLKVKNLLMVAFPIYLVFIYNILLGVEIDWWTGICSAVGCLSLMIAVNLYNDYLDHMSGLDRLHPHSESHVIQKGWVTGAQMQNWSVIYGILGALFGLPAIFLYPQILWLLAGVGLIGSFGLASYRMGLRYRRWSEVTVLLLLGPMLTAGIQLSFGAPINSEVISLGFFTGTLSLFYLHLKNFEQLMVNEKAKFENTITYLGFEKSKVLLKVFWILILLGQIYFYWQYSPSTFMVIQVLMNIYLTYRFFSTLKKLSSPVGSLLRRSVFEAQKGIFMMMSLWSIDLLWMAFYR